jgi:spermidine/putrescine transport system permease protein
MKGDLWFQRVSVGTIWFWLAVFALLPNLMVLAASLMQRGDTEFLRFVATLENYRRLLDPLYLQVLWNSFYLAALSTLFSLVVGYPFAYLLARAPVRLSRFLILLVIIPFWTSSLVRTYAIIIILKTRGIANSVLLWTGLIDQPLALLHNDLAVFIGLVYTLLPFMVLPLYASIEKLDFRLVEAARDLGASRAQTFTRIIIPLTMPGILAGSMLVFLPALGMFYIPDLLGGARTLLVGNLIKNQFLSARDWPFGAAVSVVLTAVMTLLLVAYYRSSNRTTGHGGLP